MEFITPLSRRELDQLGDMLLNRIDEDADTEGKDEGILGIPDLDGFLTAIVSGPELVLPSRWLPAVWGDFEPIWGNEEQLQTFMALIMSHSNSIAGFLLNDPESFEPIFYERRVENRSYTIVDEWCEGYMRAVRLSESVWSAGGSEIEALLLPIRAFTEESNWRGHDMVDEQESERLRGLITPNARAIHARWLAARLDAPSSTRRGAPRIGRNDPCPCGSGKKFKRCCLH